MAFKKVKTFKITRENETGEKYEASLAMQICTDSGRFRIEVPEDLSKIVKASGVKMHHPKSNEKYIYAFGDSLKAVENIIRNAVDELLTCKIETDVVIVYQFYNRTHYYKKSDGTLEFNAIGVEDYGNKDVGAWVGGEGVGSFDETEGMGINIFIQVLEQVRYIRPSTTTAKYNNYCHRSMYDKETGEVCWNGFRGEHCVDYPLARELFDACHSMNGNSISDLNHYHELDINNTIGDYKMIKYSEENCLFFLNMLKGMCKLADKFNEFFKHEPAEIEKLIKSKTRLLE